MIQFCFVFFFPGNGRDDKGQVGPSPWKHVCLFSLSMWISAKLDKGPGCMSVPILSWGEGNVFAGWT